jgi:23S rRNA (uracil1939-C5)-methyltransferase
MREGDLLTVAVVGLTPEGDGRAVEAGRTLQIEGALPGETVQCRVLHVARARPIAHCRVVEVLSPRPDRREAACPRHPSRGGQCGGCALLPLDDAAQRELLPGLLLEAYGLRVDALHHLPGGELGYRWSSKRVAFGRPGRLRLGSYARGSHRRADMAGCLLEHPRIEEAFAELAEVSSQLGIVPFEEETGRGDLRYVWAKTDGQSVVLTLVTAGEASRAKDSLPAALRVPATVAWSVQPSRGNAVRGGAPVILRGGPFTATMAGVDVEVGPLGFLQPNPAMIAEAYRALVGRADGGPHAGARALDLYAGAGVTTALLRERFAEVTPVESYAESADSLGVPPTDVADFLDALLADPAAPRPELVVANPPRKGLGAKVVERLVALGAPHLQIMSCGPAGLAADLRGLVDDGPYRLVRLTAFQTLPQTTHVELVAWLERG